MKKLLVLLMVLGLVSSANAALSLTLSLSTDTIAVGGTTTLTVNSGDKSDWSGNLILSDDVINWNVPVVADWGTGTGSGMGNIGAITYDASGYHAAITLLVASNVSPISDVVAGNQFSIVITGMQAGTIYVSLQDLTTQEEITTNGAPLALVVTPEPMTIALLGLGGLFLRRRK